MKIKSAIAFLFILLSSHGYAEGLSNLAKNQGFFFFYSSSCPHCQRFAPTLKRVSTQYTIPVVAISVDGGFLSSFPNAVMDEGQSSVFQVTVLPALFLVNPQNQSATLVTEGAISEEELISRLIKISQLHKTKVAV